MRLLLQSFQSLTGKLIWTIVLALLIFALILNGYGSYLAPLPIALRWLLILGSLYQALFFFNLWRKGEQPPQRHFLIGLIFLAASIVMVLELTYR
jgi:hypothetical protein